MEDLSSSPPKFDYEPPKRSKKVKNLPLAPFVPKPTPKPRKKKVREPDFVVHQDSESEEEVNERILALEAWIDDDEMDRIRPNGETTPTDGFRINFEHNSYRFALSPARTSCHLDSSDEEKAAIVSPSKRRRKGKGVKVRSDEERSDSKSITPPSYITNKHPLVASLIAAR